MKQLYFLMIVGLLFSGVVLVNPKLQGKHELLDQILNFLQAQNILILLAIFDLGVSLGNCVWVRPGGINFIDNLIPSLVLLLASIFFFYSFFLNEVSGYTPKQKWLAKFLNFIHRHAIILGITCLVMGVVHFFLESVVLL